jgi:hypothetical protein
MPRTTSLWGKLGGGDCSAIAAAFMSDIAGTSDLQHGWRHVAGDCRGIGRHHWVEASGWAFDFSHGDRRPAIVMRSRSYVAMRRGYVHRLMRQRARGQDRHALRLS